ncbi:hypothetical protein COO91_02801 [Nostoc flagelliforme CCNUN1]|uniref:Uncharacterized protein n=1 Tax=Nostoc flagelliforme CCNUN1 TaxID=2038116 RepID=A0A2K8SN29_9NOSO|nr:hypothetical protein COO91_02801 [Nostoc flagelliforme CCNUN1]
MRLIVRVLLPRAFAVSTIASLRAVLLGAWRTGLAHLKPY